MWVFAPPRVAGLTFNHVTVHGPTRTPSSDPIRLKEKEQNEREVGCALKRTCVGFEKHQGVM